MIVFADVLPAPVGAGADNRDVARAQDGGMEKVVVLGDDLYLVAGQMPCMAAETALESAVIPETVVDQMHRRVVEVFNLRHIAKYLQ